jgi:phosphoribosylamine--glycine ligase
VTWKAGAAVCIVASSNGYPGEYHTGIPIRGLEKAAQEDDCLVFHAGTRLQDGEVLTDGGRVLSVTGMGFELPEAVSRAYAAMKQISFDGMHYRHDIADKALGRHGAS